MTTKFDLIVVGGGILGTFHAYHALKKNLKVALLERNSVPQGATVRNFGQVVPSGMDLKWQNFGRESLAIYQELHTHADLTIRQNGSVYIASNDEELQLIEELYEINRNNDYDSVLLSKNDCIKKFDGLRSDYCKGGLFFPQELSVDPADMIVKLHKLLQEKMGLQIFYNTTVLETHEDDQKCTAIAADGTAFNASKIIICGGHEFKTLYPKVFNDSDLEVSKLQMLQTKPQGIYSLQGNILTGLSVRRYESFGECPSYQKIKAAEDPNSFEKKYGIHILFKQALDGSVIIGDSHEYADAKNADDLGYDLNMEIDEFMIHEAKKIIDLPTYEIQRRWFGIYSQCKTKDIFEHSPSANIHIVTGIGGKGMTGSGGFSKFNIEKFTHKTEMKNIELLVLDMAGTTIDEDNVVYKTLTSAVNDYGYSVSLEKVLSTCAGMEKLEAITSLLKEINGKEEDAPAIFEKFSEQLKESYKNLDVKPINGTEDFLLSMKSQNKKIVLNTGYTSEIAHQLLNKLNWKESIHFDALITADDVSESRPSPEMIHLAMKKFNITEAHKVLKAGDSVIDIEEGKNAGCGLTVAVLSGAQTQSELEKAAPDYILNTISEAKDIL